MRRIIYERKKANKFRKAGQKKRSVEPIVLYSTSNTKLMKIGRFYRIEKHLISDTIFPGFYSMISRADQIAIRVKGK